MELPANHEQPSGHIRVNVSQPELLYQLAKIPFSPKIEDFVTELSFAPIKDQLLLFERSVLNKVDPKYVGIRSYQYATQLDLVPHSEDSDEPFRGYYTPERNAAIMADLKQQGVAYVSTDEMINGQRRLKIYHPGGSYGVEVLLGWTSNIGFPSFRNSEETKKSISKTIDQAFNPLADKEKNMRMKEEIQHRFADYQPSPAININLVNRKRLDTSEGWNLMVPIPENLKEFLDQTEFYRKTLEQVLKAVYAEAEVNPNLDITLRPPNLSGDSIDRQASISGENIQTITEEQLRPEMVTLDDVRGQPEAVREARRFVRAINQPELYTRRGGKPPRGALFVGPPGTGKTMIAKGIATEAQAEFKEINAANIGSKYINESAQLMNQVFDDAESKIAAGKKVIIFIDEIDAIAQLRQNAHPEDVKTISVMLQRLDGLITKPGVVLLAATNRPEAIDPAIVRPGRIDRIIEVGLPNEDGRKDILQSYIDKTKGKAEAEYKETLFDANIDLNNLASQTNGLSGAELANLIGRVFDMKLELELEGQGWHPITTQDLLNAVPVVKIETQKRRTLGFHTGVTE